MNTFQKDYEMLKSIIERDEDEHLARKRLLHSEWDKHILMLATLSIGFVFSFVPLDECYEALVWFGILFFVVSISLTILSFYFANRGDKIYDPVLKQKKSDIQELGILSNYLNMITETLKVTSDEKQKTKLQDEISLTIDKLRNNLDKYRAENLSEVNTILDLNNRNIDKCNNSKTISYLIGIILVVAYSFINRGSF